MKLREVFYLLGFRPKIKKFGYETETLSIGGEEVKWARWQHPKCRSLEPRRGDLPFLKKFLKKGDFVIDIGAHVGDTTIAQAVAVGREGAVLALEPNPNVYEILEANAALNRPQLNICPLRAAAMAEEGSYTFQYNDPGLCNGGYQKGISLFKHASFFKVEVQGINLENYLKRHFPERLERLKLIKTDTEGFDYKLFRLNLPLVEKHRPCYQAEINRNMTVEERLRFLEELEKLDYNVYALNGISLENLEPARKERFKDAAQTFDLFAVPKTLIATYFPNRGFLE